MRTYSTSGTVDPGTFYEFAVTSGASANAKGAWTNITYLMPFDCESLWVSVAGGHLGYTYMLDVGIDDGSGNIRILAENLSFGGDTLNQSNGGGTFITLPLHIPKNLYLALRVSCSVGSETISGNVTLIPHGLGGAPGYARCLPLTESSNSRGVTVDCGANANTNVRTELVASTAVGVHGLVAMIGPNADTAITTSTRIKFSLDIGAAGEEMPFWSGHMVCREITLDLVRPTFLPFRPFYIPAGSRLSVNAQCNITTTGDRTFDLMLYGFQ